MLNKSEFDGTHAKCIIIGFGHISVVFFLYH